MRRAEIREIGNPASLCGRQASCPPLFTSCCLSHWIYVKPFYFLAGDEAAKKGESGEPPVDE